MGEASLIPWAMNVGRGSPNPPPDAPALSLTADPASDAAWLTELEVGTNALLAA